MNVKDTVKNRGLEDAIIESPDGTPTVDTITAHDGASFVAVNYISCEQEYIKEFEWMFKTRAHAIDRIPGFISMEVLRPSDASAYLIVSR